MRDGAGLSFPCDYEVFENFLAEADAYRRLGKSLRTFKAPASLLAANVTMRVPFVLPTVTVSFELAASPGAGSDG